MATEASNDINDLYHHDRITKTQTDTKVIPKVEETSKSPREKETKIQKNREDIREKLNLLISADFLNANFHRSIQPHFLILLLHK